MKMEEPYEIHQMSEMHYQFVTENHIVYDAIFMINEDYFPNFPEGCPTCSDILELTLNSSDEGAKTDKRTGQTVFKILDNLLSKSCNGVIYRCRDDDARGCFRERKFESWFEEFADEEKIDKWVNDFSDGGVQGKTYLMVDKGCLNYNQVVDDFSYQCEPCLKLQQEQEGC